LQADGPEIHQALVRYSSNTIFTDFELHERKRTELKDWLHTLRLRLETEGLRTRQ